MPSTVVLVKREFREDGTVYIEFSDGSGLIKHLADLRDDVMQLDENLELAKSLAIARAFASSNDLSSISVVENKQLTFDLTQADPIKLGPLGNGKTGTTALRT